MKRKMPNKKRLEFRYNSYLEYAKRDNEKYGFLSEQCAHDCGIVHGIGFALGYDFDRVTADIDNFLGLTVVDC